MIVLYLNLPDTIGRRRTFKKNGRPKSLLARYLMNRWLDLIQIWSGGSVGISDDLINFWE